MILHLSFFLSFRNGNREGVRVCEKEEERQRDTERKRERERDKIEEETEIGRSGG